MEPEPRPGDDAATPAFDLVRRRVMRHAQAATRDNLYGGPAWERLAWEIALEVLDHAADYFWTVDEGKHGTILHEAYLILSNGYDPAESELVHTPRPRQPGDPGPDRHAAP